jgi:glycosyltransferase involved in cell wall biosynthesis
MKPLFARQRILNASLRLLSWAAQQRATNGGYSGRDKPIRRVVHVSPAYFSDESYIGGGERWAMSLAEAMATTVDTTFVSFGPRRNTIHRGALRVEAYPGFDTTAAQAHSDIVSLRFLRELRGADVVHCHHFRTVVTSLALLVGKLAGVRTFVTDLGGSAPRFAGDVDTTEFVDCFLHLSEYAAKILPDNGRVVYGGVNEAFCHPRARSDQPREQVLCVARLLPHKGINYLIEAMDADQPLELIGKAYRSDYFQLLQSLSSSKQVRFTLDASDEDLIVAYQRSLVTVLPSVYKDIYGIHTEVPELLGLVLLESMACGTPVICTNVGSMPELVEDRVTGLIVPPNDPSALRQAIRFLREHPAIASEMAENGRQRVLQRFTWKHIAETCLAAYRQP